MAKACASLLGQWLSVCRWILNISPMVIPFHCFAPPPAWEAGMQQNWCCSFLDPSNNSSGFPVRFRSVRGGFVVIPADVNAGTNKFQKVYRCILCLSALIAARIAANFSSCHGRSCSWLENSGSNTDGNLEPPWHFFVAVSIHCLRPKLWDPQTRKLWWMSRYLWPARMWRTSFQKMKRNASKTKKNEKKKRKKNGEKRIMKKWRNQKKSQTNKKNKKKW